MLILGISFGKDLVKMRRKLLASLLALCLVVGLLTTAVLAAEDGADSETPVTITITEADMGQASYEADQTGTTGVTVSDEEALISAVANPVVTKITIDSDITLKTQLNITRSLEIDGGGHRVTIDPEVLTTNVTYLFCVSAPENEDRAEVSICNIILDGGQTTRDNYNSSDFDNTKKIIRLLDVMKNADVTLLDNVCVTGGHAFFGAGIIVASGCTLTIDGAEVQYNKGNRGQRYRCIRTT